MDFDEFKLYVQEWAKYEQNFQAFKNLEGERGTQKVDDLRTIHSNLTSLQWNQFVAQIGKSEDIWEINRRTLNASILDRNVHGLKELIIHENLPFLGLFGQLDGFDMAQKAKKNLDWVDASSEFYMTVGRLIYGGNVGEPRNDIYPETQRLADRRLLNFKNGNYTIPDCFFEIFKEQYEIQFGWKAENEVQELKNVLKEKFRKLKEKKNKNYINHS